MTVCWFALFRDLPVRLAPADIARLDRCLAAVPGLSQGLIFTPDQAHDPYLHDGAPPGLGLQLYFPDIAALEAAVAADGPLRALAEPAAAPAVCPALAGAAATQQAMLVRRFPVPQPRPSTAAAQPCCTYLVAYDGPAEDLNAWLSHYVAHHPPIMAQFPGIRAIEIYTRLDWCGGLPWPRATCMQRNKVVFDDAAALTAALNSPVRHLMRADFARFPRFSGAVTHYPLATTVVSAQQ
jgi:hypothetical protein